MALPRGRGLTPPLPLPPAEGGQGQRGLIGCLACSPSQPVFACGSYGRSLGLYALEGGGALALWPRLPAAPTHLRFSPDGTRLFVGGRKVGGAGAGRGEGVGLGIGGVARGSEGAGLVKGRGLVGVVPGDWRCGLRGGGAWVGGGWDRGCGLREWGAGLVKGRGVGVGDVG